MPSSDTISSRRIELAWGAALAALVIYALWRIGGFDLTTTLESGRTVPNTYGTVDHPFHASRGAALLDSLRNGDLLRWMGSHQGGYPVEFYPLGVAWFDVIAWAMLLGSVPILAVHKLTVAIIFILPALAYWLLVRGDRIHPSIAFLAMAFHMAVPGYWLNGGYEELVGWGLVTNVAGATFGLIATVLLARYVLYRQHWHGVAAVIAIAAAAVSNPRALFGIVLATLAIAIWSLVTSDEETISHRLRFSLIPIAAVGSLAFLLAAPVIMALLAYNQHYFFLHYQFYDPLSMFWDALELALSPRLLLLAIGGGLLAFVARFAGKMRVSQVLALTTLLYSIFTIWVASTDNPPPLVEQLEAPRLMPFQRLLMLALAAFFVVVAVQWLTARLPGIWREAIIAVVVLGLGLGSVQMMSNRGDDVALNANAMYEVSTIGDQRFADFEDAVHLANDVRPEGTAVFVVGNQNEWWHEQLWAPGIEQGTYYYDDWLWYWHSDQPGPYNPLNGYYMPNPTDALTEEYFGEHGIGVVLMSDMPVSSGTAPRQSAASSDLLEPQGTFGDWDVYTVKSPTSMITSGSDQPDSLEWSNEKIHASFSNTDGSILVRQNWFPRWQAEVNGESVEIARTPSGYMQIAVPEGAVELTLTYAVTPLDWAARGMSAVGIAGLAAFAWRGKMLVAKTAGEAQRESA